MQSGSGFARALREAAPSLSKRFFSCHRARTPPSRLNIIPQPFSSAQQLNRSSLAQAKSARPWKDNARSYHQSRLFSASASAWSAATTQELRGATKSRFPDTSSKIVAYWLLGSAASVFGIVVFGGLTRLTESGLSITEWKPVTGSLPPMSEADWASEFLKYQSSPEFHLLNSKMTLEEFKSIYWMEWIHRLWGRAIGLTFVLPAIYFVARKQVSKQMMLRLTGIAGLIGFQGFIGWWMVKSGLKDDLFAPGSHPRVSQYRLTAHLGTAFICYVAMLWNGLSILRTNRLLSMPIDQATSTLFSLRNPALKPFKISVALLTALVFTTAMSGGLVAGLDAGLIYNEFPYMGLGLTPPKSELFDKFYSRDPDQKDLMWRNFLENPSLVQLDHRILATTTFTAVMALFAYSKLSSSMVQFLPRAAKRGMHGVVGFVWLQVILGISTLLYLVPTGLASAHQAGSLALLTWTIVLGGRVWYPTAAARILQQRMLAATKGGNTAGLQTFPGIGKTVFPPAAATGTTQAPGGVVMASMMPIVTAAGLLASTFPTNRATGSNRSPSTPIPTPLLSPTTTTTPAEEDTHGSDEEKRSFLRSQCQGKNWSSRVV